MIPGSNPGDRTNFYLFFKLEYFCVRSLFFLEAYQVQVTRTFLRLNQRLLAKNRLRRISPRAPQKPLVQRWTRSLIRMVNYSKYFRLRELAIRRLKQL